MKGVAAAMTAVLAGLVGCPRAPTSAADACGDGLALALGACVPYRLADSLCGKASKPAAGTCARTACPPGEALDLDHGLCLPESMVLATLLHGHPLDEGDTRRATCHEGVLTSRAGRLRCMSGPRSCERGEHFVKRADGGPEAGTCEPVPACGVGEMFDEAVSKCARLARTGAFDVGTWARLALGSDGAEGTNAFCAPVRAAIAATPTSTGLPPARFQIRVTVPDNDVTRATARVTARPGTATAAEDAAERSLDELVQVLHFQGGTSVAASVSLDVICTPGGGPEPTLEPPH